MQLPSEFVPVAIHRSVRPEAFADGLRRNLEQRQIDPKFHYLTARQARVWLELHHRYSPFVTSAGGTAVYDEAFAAVAGQLASGPVHLLSLACGGAGKEWRLVQALQRVGKELTATVSDISVPLVLAGHATLTQTGQLTGVKALALDLLANEGFTRDAIPDAPITTPRLITCFGLMPNVEPLAIASRLNALTGPTDLLLVGANLVPEENYEQGTYDVLGGYDNEATRHWLELLLTDIGFESGDGEIRFTVEACASRPEILQIVARYHLLRNRVITSDGVELKFTADENMRLFFSNRYTPARLKRLFTDAGLSLRGEWISAEKTEGIIACGK